MRKIRAGEKLFIKTEYAENSTGVTSEVPLESGISDESEVASEPVDSVVQLSSSALRASRCADRVAALFYGGESTSE